MTTPESDFDLVHQVLHVPSILPPQVVVGAATGAVSQTTLPPVSGELLSLVFP